MIQRIDSHIKLGPDWSSLLEPCRPLHIRYSAGEMICQVGSYVAGVHVVMAGAVADTFIPESEALRRTEIAGPGDLIGLEVLEPSSAGLARSLCRALTSVDLLFVERGRLETGLSGRSELETALRRYAISRIQTARSTPGPHAPAEVRLGWLLLRLYGLLPVDRQEPVLPVEIGLRTLADLLDLSSRQMRVARHVLTSLVASGDGLRFDPMEAARIARGVTPSALYSVSSMIDR